MQVILLVSNTGLYPFVNKKRFLDNDYDDLHEYDDGNCNL